MIVPTASSARVAPGAPLPLGGLPFIPFRRAADGEYEVNIADLFCGAGGTSTGAVKAIEALQRRFGIKIRTRIVAVNHWPVAIQTHSANHSFAQHYCNGLTGVDPREVIPGLLDLLVASPECTHHSNARGGKPMNDQSRSSGDDVVRWVDIKRPAMVLIENVREYRGWGPLVEKVQCSKCKWSGAQTLAAAHGSKKGKKAVPCDSIVYDVLTDKAGLPYMVPDPHRKGEYFQAFLAKIRALGYRVDDQLLCAADYGDPTTRVRLFVVCRRGVAAPSWPKATHTRYPERSLIAGLLPWRPAKDLIDWTRRGQSIFNRKHPLKPNTMRRIAAGLKKFSHIDIEAYLLTLYGTSKGGVSAALPSPAVTGGGNHLYVVQPFVLGQQSGAVARSTEEPVQGLAARGAISKTEPYLVQYHGTSGPQSVKEPLGAVTGKDRFGVAKPFIVANFNERDGQAPRVHDVEEPPPTVTQRGMGDLVVPFVTEYHSTQKEGGERVRPVSDTLPTQDCANRYGIVDPKPFVVTAAHGDKTPDENIDRRARSTDEPLGAATGSNEFGLAQPEAFQIRSDCAGGKTAGIRAITDPTATATGSGGLGVVKPEAFMLSAGGPAVDPRSVQEPAHTVLTRDHMGVASPEAFIVGAGGPARAGEPQPVTKPVGTIMASSATKAIIEPRAFVVPMNHDNPPVSVNAPAPAVTTQGNRLNLAQPEAFAVETTHQDKAGADPAARTHSLEEPSPVVTGANRGELALVAPFADALDGATVGSRKVVRVEMVQYTHNVLAQEPQNCLLLTFEDGARWLLDIFFRMFHYRELARAQSFPDDYVFKGTGSDIVKQIGNAVPVELAQALVMECLLQMDWGNA